VNAAELPWAVREGCSSPTSPSQVFLHIFLNVTFEVEHLFFFRKAKLSQIKIPVFISCLIGGRSLFSIFLEVASRRAVGREVLSQL